MAVSLEEWAQLKELFRVAIEHEPSERAAYLEQACVNNAALRAEIESLLASHDGAETFIEAPAFANAVNAITETPIEQIEGQRIGSYRLIREIGRGGMGTVYLAERADEQYQKLVAIKVVRRGMDTEDILRRFRNERQILAHLDHPNIARLLDGGTTDDGLPYLVMEHVHGLPVVQYCDEHRLPTGERLQIFRTICAAVQHAHQRLVVHRDLKPSNILVTPDGTPKLLDFGIAKVINPEVSTSLNRTLTEFRVLTPDYASPEQVRGETLTTTSDVYSLGVVLYELLTGHRPYRSIGTPPHELARVICEQEPAKPSATINHIETVAHGRPKPQTTITPEIVSRARDTQPDKLRRRLLGDLDNIILMALRKEPARRYASADQFSEDIRRHLNGLPVVARKDTFTYRAAKFVRRNRLGVTAAGIILFSLLGGIVATLWQARAAQQEKARAESVNTFLKKMLKYSNPRISVPGKGSGETTMKDVLDEAVERLDSAEFSNQLEVKAELERIIGESYGGQGRQDLWEQHLKRYIDIERSLYGENDPKMIVANATWAMLLEHKDSVESEKIFRRVLPLMRTEYRKRNIAVQDLAEALNNFGYLRRTQGDSKEAESLFREALSLSSELPVEEQYWIVLTRSTLASTLADQGRFDEALQTAREAVAEERQRGRIGTPNFGFSLTILGGFLADKGYFADADSNLREAETILRQRMSPSALWLGDNLRNQAISLYRQGKYVEAQSKVTETEKIYLESFGPGYDHYPTVLITKGLILDKTGKSQEGESFLREALRLRVQSLPKEHFWIALAGNALGECLTTQQRFAEAEPLLIESYASLNSHLGLQDPRTIEALRRLARLYQAWNKPEQAAQYLALF
ncbi:MAG: eukaryotic-like serine/threonine-protein kinase [Blastocatellia bacterium]|jgi:tetratricopeptide (TPR) repeat protein|nr:eukaryotic-like serine/threonine-protein kinase [Blastocatellia bacterium]